MRPITVIGVGPGNAALLTDQAVRAIAQSEICFCATRHAHLAPDPRRIQPLEPLSSAMDSIERLWREGRPIAVLLSGDVGIYSMLPMLSARFGAENLSVVPGIGAVQALCAAAKESWQDAKIVSGHGRALSVSSLCHTARTHKKTILFCDARRGARWAAEALFSEDLGPIQLIIGERLSYPEEAITRATAAEISEHPEWTFDPLCLLMLINPAPAKGMPCIGLHDDLFLRGKTPMTKREIRVQILAELRLPIDAVVWDIGAGTGSVSIECARQCPQGQVIAIERSADATGLIHQNSERFRLHNLAVVEGRAPESLAGLPAPTHVFIGGSGGEMDGIFDAIESFEASVRVVCTAVTLEGESAMEARLSRYADFTLSQLSVSRMEAVGSYHMMKAQNPVRIAAGTWEGKR